MTIDQENKLKNIIIKSTIFHDEITDDINELCNTMCTTDFIKASQLSHTVDRINLFLNDLKNSYANN